MSVYANPLHEVLVGLLDPNKPETVAANIDVIRLMLQLPEVHKHWVSDPKFGPHNQILNLLSCFETTSLPHQFANLEGLQQYLPKPVAFKAVLELEKIGLTGGYTLEAGHLDGKFNLRVNCTPSWSFSKKDIDGIWPRMKAWSEYQECKGEW